MKVALDTSPLFTTRAGVARYVRGLLNGLQLVRPAGIEIDELVWPVENFGYAQPQRALKTLAREWGWARWIAPRRARDASVVHHTALPIIPFFAPARHVVTLHDVAVLRHPERFRRWQRRSALRGLRQVLHADRVICVSQFTADEAMQLIGLPSKRITVVHEGGWFQPVGVAAAGDSASLSELPAEFFLFVGSLEPGKNLALLRDVYVEASAAGTSLPPLLIAGSRWAGVAREGPPPPEWRFLGHVSDAQLSGLYRAATALLFPSRYEGFGLPVIEALGHGCPVVSGELPSVREIGGDAVCYAELSTAGFGAAVRRVGADARYRAELRAAGLARAGRFSWEKCARETAAVYASLTVG